MATPAPAPNPFAQFSFSDAPPASAAPAPAQTASPSAPASPQTAQGNPFAQFSFSDSTPPPTAPPATAAQPPAAPPQSVGQNIAGLAEDVGLNAVAGFGSLPRSVAQGADYLLHEAGVPGANASGVIGAIPNPLNTKAPLFPTFGQAKSEMQTGLGIQPFVPVNAAEKYLDTGLTAAAMAAGSPEAIPSAIAGSLTAQGVNDVAPGHPLLAAAAGLLGGGATLEAGRIAGSVAKTGANVVNNIARPAAVADSAASRADQTLVAQLLAPGVAGRRVLPVITGTPVSNGGLTVAETLGQQGTGGTAALTRQPGVAGDLAASVLGTRQAGRVDRLVQGFQQATGIDPTAARANIEQMVAGGRDSVNPAYTAIRANPEPVMTPGLQQLLDTDPHVQGALKTVMANTRNPPAVPDAAIWLRVRQQLADNVQRDPLTGKPQNVDFNDQVNAAASDLGAELKNAIPGFGDAQAQAALYKAPQTAYQNARGMLFGGTAKQTPADVQALWDSATTPGQQAAIQHAFAADILDRANGAATGSRLTPANFLAPGVQQKLAIVFGDPAASNIGRVATQEKQMQAFENRVLPNNNSITAEATNHGNAIGEMAMDAAPHLLTGNLHHAALAVGKTVLGKVMSNVKTNGDLAFRNEMAKRYLSDAATFTTPKIAVPSAGGKLPLLPAQNVYLLPQAMNSSGGQSTP